METLTAANACAEAPLRLSDYQFALPPELIAQVPTAERGRSRLLVLSRTPGTLTHTAVSALPDHLRRGDLLVVNDTRVIPARIFGHTASGAAIELLLVRRQAGGDWLCLGRPAKRLRLGTEVLLASGVQARIIGVHGGGRYTIALAAAVDVMELLNRHGEIPLPPYIQRPDGPLPLDHSRYQTIFAARPGAIAAPTAGLHFTDTLLAALRARGIELARITLHVGPGTFLPVRVDDISQHVMEAEWCEIPPETAAAIQRVKAAGGRVIAVGTTTTRALESAVTDDGVQAGARWAERFIVPGFRFRVIDALFTNFHLPGSTLLLLVAALVGRERILAAYAEAIRQRYRFYSYGDAMLVQ